MSLGKGTHYKGPLLGRDDAAGGAFEDVSLAYADRMRSPYHCFYEDFVGLASGVTTDLEGAGWTETAVGTAASRTWAYSSQIGALIINADTVAAEGTSAQFNAASAATLTSHQHMLLPAITSTTTLMSNRELIWATRIGFLVGNGITYDSAALLGWFVTDTALMTPSTGALAIASGGGIGFHINGVAGTGDRSIGAVVQGTTVATEISTGVVLGVTASFFITYYDLAFRARWIDSTVGTGVVDFFVNGKRRVSVSGATVALPMQSTQTYSNTIELINGAATADQVDMGVEYIFNAITRPGLLYPYSTGMYI
jgi:hypothetical protein